ncbi:MAG: methyltransferase [Candidatus Pacearchaeota archaeon]|nr:MAG: methyltransferase [Candidatus Pacearchaeota archaeon]
MKDSILLNINKRKIKEVRFNNTSHFLINGDSLKILKNIKGCNIDLIITDPPYNVGLDYGPYSKDRKRKEEYFAECRIWLKECARLLKNTGSFYLINYPEINARLLPFIEDELKLKFRRWITWHYPTNIGHSKKNFTRSQRSILFFTKSNKYTFNRENIIQHYKNPEVKKIKERIKNGSKGRTSYDLLRFLDLIELSKGMIDVLDINLLKNVSKDRFNKKHPCQLPLELLRIFVKVSSNKNDILLDPFAGTFTLSAVAKELNRNSIGIEINPDYIKLGLKRLKK